MASTYPSCHFYSSSSSSSSIPNSTSTTRFSLSFSRSVLDPSFSRNSLRKGVFRSRLGAKFEKFQGEPPQENLDDTTLSSSQSAQKDYEEEEDDSCLPSDLEGAVRQSSQASALFVSSGGTRAIVELLIPQLQFLDDEGAQAELWELSRIFLDTLIQETECQFLTKAQKELMISRSASIVYRFPFMQKVKAIFPDAGASALLKYRWEDAAFGFSSLSDRKPVEKEDEIVVMVVPDYQMLGYVEKIASDLSDDPPRPLIMWNPRLISEDVGVGFNVRKLRRYFLSTFTTVYSMRPLPSGAVFRCYPGLWKVFYDDKDRPNRYLLAKELVRRPDAEDLEMIYGDVQENSEMGGPSFFDRAVGMFSSINRFMRVITK